jgi:hydrogenase nickel incorporation protein HypA/HybF
VHELSLSRAILDSALRHAEGKRVKSVRLRVGALRQVVPGTLAFYFELTARGTPCEGADLEQQGVPAILRCESCREEWRMKEPSFRCPLCDCGTVQVISGEELEIESIEVEEDAACTGSG